MPVLLAEYFEDFQNSEDAYCAYLRDLEELARHGSISTVLALHNAKCLQEHVDRLNEAFEIGKPSSKFSPDWRCQTKVFIGDAKGRQYTRFIGTDRVVALDWTSIVKLVLLIYWIGWDGEDTLAQGLSAFLLVSYVVDQSDDFPHVEEILSVLHSHNSRLIGDLTSLVGDFLLFHELGHIYCDQKAPDFLSIKFITPDSYHAGVWRISDTPIYNGCSLFNYEVSEDGSQVGAILIDAEFVDWREEFACDVFAIHGLLYASSEEDIRDNDIAYVCDAISIWQVILWIIDWKQRMSLKQKSDAAIPQLSHPPSKLRFDFLIYHTFKLAAEHLPPEVNIPLGMAFQHAATIWGKDMEKVMAETIEYSFYGFDEDSDRVNVGKLHSFVADGHIPYHPSAFEQIRRQILQDFIPNATASGWDNASKEIQPRFKQFIDTYKLNERPIVRELGEQLHEIGLRLVSEDRT